ncbi:TraB/GumN family protein [Rheinheimera sp.]|uniref:TraB/GumN family protein n=1 Tax=Rheinheimera sp. TaxID=1869214 RepID=UPI00307ED82D
MGRLLGILVLVVLASSTQANSLWQVTKGKQQFYLAGTIHLLSPDDYPLPASYEQALSESRQLILETPLDQLESPEGISLLLQRNRYPDGENLLQHLSPALAGQLSEFCQQHQLPLQQISRFKPAFAALMLTSTQLQQQGATAPGVDKYLMQQASQKTIPHLGFETVEQHLAVLDKLNQQGAELLIQSTLQDLRSSTQDFVAMKQAWRQGNVQVLEQLFLSDLLKYPALYQILIVERNQAWLQKLPTLLNNKPSYIAVGTLHLVGKDGLLHALQQQGYNIRQVH